MLEAAGFWCKTPSDAGIAQLVERNLAKVEVASSNLVSRSRLSEGTGRIEFLPWLLGVVAS